MFIKDSWVPLNWKRMIEYYTNVAKYVRKQMQEGEENFEQVWLE